MIRRLCVQSFALALLLFASSPAAAQPDAAHAIGARPLLFAVRFEPPQTGSPRVLAVEYSDHYRRRAALHRYASFATLPLFGAEAWVGQSLYNNPTDAKKSLHLTIAAGMGGLFAVNSFTGVLNLVEARKDPNGRGRRLLHGILLLAADAGFLGAAMTAPERDHGRNGSATSDGSRGLHRALAFSSISLTTVGYLIMLIK